MSDNKGSICEVSITYPGPSLSFSKIAVASKGSDIVARWPESRDGRSSDSLPRFVYFQNRYLELERASITGRMSRDISLQLIKFHEGMDGSFLREGFIIPWRDNKGCISVFQRGASAGKESHILLFKRDTGGVLIRLSTLRDSFLLYQEKLGNIRQVPADWIGDMAREKSTRVLEETDPDEVS